MNLCFTYDYINVVLPASLHVLCHRHRQKMEGLCRSDLLRIQVGVLKPEFRISVGHIYHWNQLAVMSSKRH